jgi:hypothetical protein
MFCGWRLVSSYRELERLGSGTLQIDALTRTCSFNRTQIRPLSIADELHVWLVRDLQEHGINLADLREASLTADLRFGSVDTKDRLTRVVHFEPSGAVVSPPKFLSCEITCHSRVATDEVLYISEYRDLEEWPAGWPR